MWILAKAAGLWRSLPGELKAFALGLLAGLLLSTLSFLPSSRQEKIALQNANAALDSTRKIAAKHDTLYARLLVQKDVELSGALGTVASLRGDNARLAARLAVRSAESHTTATHDVAVGTGPAVGVGGDSLRRDAVPGGTEADGGGASVSDSLVIAGPPVTGTVGVTVTAQDDTSLRFQWDARLRPSPIDLSVALGCGKDGPELVANGPPWASVDIQPGTVDPEVCNPQVHISPVGRGLQIVGAAAIIVTVVKGVLNLVH